VTLTGYLVSDKLTAFVLNVRFLVQYALTIFLIIMEDWKLNALTVVKLYR